MFTAIPDRVSCVSEPFFFLTHHGTYPQQQCVIMILIADVDTVI